MSLTFQLLERCLPFLPLKPNNHETNPTCNSQKKMGWVKSQWDCRFEGADQKVAVLKRPTMFAFIMFWVPWRLLIVLENSLMYISEQHTIKKYWTKIKRSVGPYTKTFSKQTKRSTLKFFFASNSSPLWIRKVDPKAWYYFPIGA